MRNRTLAVPEYCAAGLELHQSSALQARSLLHHNLSDNSYIAALLPALHSWHYYNRDWIPCILMESTAPEASFGLHMTESLPKSRHNWVVFATAPCCRSTLPDQIRVSRTSKMRLGLRPFAPTSILPAGSRGQS